MAEEWKDAQPYMFESTNFCYLVEVDWEEEEQIRKKTAPTEGDEACVIELFDFLKEEKNEREGTNDDVRTRILLSLRDARSLTISLLKALSSVNTNDEIAKEMCKAVKRIIARHKQEEDDRRNHESEEKDQIGDGEQADQTG